jgi:membrane protein YqaA with SNARE-associated domain
MTTEALQYYGLAGIIVFSFLGSSIIPMPMLPVEAVVALGYAMGINTAVLFTAVVLSSSLGGYTTYFIGRAGSRILDRFDSNKVAKVREHLERWGSVYVLLSSLLFIIPYDIVALCCGMMKVNKYRFLAATITGKVVRISIVLAVLKLGWG